MLHQSSDRFYFTPQKKKNPQYTDFISDEWIVLTLKWNLTKSSVLFYMQQEKVALQPAETLKYHLTIL